MSKLVSICMPVYNGEKYIKKTLESLLNQTYKNLEIIIGDNGSTDKTEEIVRKIQNLDNRIKYIKNDDNFGYSGNCNNLISISLGEYIAIYHADDVYDFKIIEKEVKILEKNTDILGVFTFGNIINEFDNLVGPLIKNKYTKSKNYLIKLNLKDYLIECLNNSNFLVCPTGMIRAKIYKDTKYSLVIKYVEDMDMWIQLLKKGNLGIINEKLINYRIHSTQVSEIFREKNLGNIPLDVKLLENYMIKDNQILKMNLNTQLNIRKSKIYATFAYQYLKLGDYKQFNVNLKKSRLLYKLKVFSKYGFFQNFFWNKNIFKIINKLLTILCGGKYGKTR